MFVSYSFYINLYLRNFRWRFRCEQLDHNVDQDDENQTVRFMVFHGNVEFKKKLKGET